MKVMIQTPQDVELLGPVTPQQSEILTPHALEFFATLQREFNLRRLILLRLRKQRQDAINAGETPDFLPETRYMREGNWRVAPVPENLQDRRVEITGPVDRKMVINALNSGANCYMADFEDSHSPTWSGTLDGQLNVRDAVRGTIEYTNPDGKIYRLNPRVATLLVRPRGWHLSEKNLLVDGEFASASLFDFAMYFYHNAHYLAAHDSGVYFYLPKMEHHLEARLWNDVFVKAQEMLDIPQGTIKATVLIEHILAAFQMEEILYELRHHSAGLNCGRWDYIFSYIKTFGARKDFAPLPDRSQVTMTSPFMRAYTLQCIKTCHKRGTFAMGGMAAYIPIKGDSTANENALQKVREDKRREAADGHDGTWVAHPGLVQIAKEEFDKVLGEKPNQIEFLRDDVETTAAQLLETPEGSITEEGLRQNIRVAIQYIESWLRGQGCVPLYNLMEDAATAEISRTQVWQWVHHPRGALAGGKKITATLVRKCIAEELAQIRKERGEERFECGRFAEAAQLFSDLSTSDRLEEFLTLKAYERLETRAVPNRNSRSPSPAVLNPPAPRSNKGDTVVLPRNKIGDAPPRVTTPVSAPRTEFDGNGSSNGRNGHAGADASTPVDERVRNFTRIESVSEMSAIENSWRTDPRWHGVTRGYNAEQVLRIRGSMKIEHTIADRMSRKLWRLLNDEPFLNALGALSGNQAVQMVQAGLKAIYLSGWQVAADNNLAGSMYPDQSLYPANSVPEVVRRINKALQRADQIQSQQGQTHHDLWAPIVADAEAGFGGVLNTYELVLQMIEAGAAGIHLEDQLSSAKKCGHMGGKVLVPAFEFIHKLRAARLAADVAGVPVVLVARTDAESAKLLTSDFDSGDKWFCTGERTEEGFFRIRGGLDLAIVRALRYAPHADMLWCETGRPDLVFARRFAEAVKKAYPDKLLAYNCSPSFNWKKNLDDSTIAKFQTELAAMGYKFQFVTLAGFHALNYAMWELASGYRDRQMAAYTELQQKEFRAEEAGYRAVKHQSFVGAGYFDEIAAICGEASTQALRESTEEMQFAQRVPTGVAA
jgi:malate synthase